MRSTTRFAAALAAACISVIGCQQDESPTGPELGPMPDVTVTAALTFSGVTAGRETSCGVSSDSRAYCWGFGLFGQLGDGTTTDRTTPTAVAGGLHFRQLSAGYDATCGVTTDHRAYCWGGNYRGEVGDGTTDERLAPVAVAGGHQFIQVETGLGHTCGVSYPDGRAWCWGLNNEGQLGNGTTDSHYTPIAVSGGLTFSRIATGEYHTCGVTTSHKVYCWGLNNYGQLGEGTTAHGRVTPKLVVGGLAFAWVDAGGYHTCAVTTDQRAYCWGDGRNGQRGDGSITLIIRTPRPVFGNHLFTKVTGGVLHTCGVTPTNQAWCWGWNADGQLGDGSRTDRLTPHLVAGGFAFNQVSSGYYHTCARTTAGVGYCWGASFYGELGKNGTTGESDTPVAVN
jgi:alpha-tubulin suppressor-like RCC1 family protein